MAEHIPGNRLGIDWGKARIGIAASSRGTTFAYPVETVAAGPDALGRIAELVATHEPEIVYVGLPLNLRGERGPAAEHILENVEAIAAALPPDLEIRLVDERLSTAQASRDLGRAGRGTRRQRSVIDQAAAVEILQRALDKEANFAEPAGELWKSDAS